MRRQRWTIGMIASFAVVFNVLLSTLMGLQALAARTDPVAMLFDMPICSADATHKQGSPAAPQKNGQECPLCGPACPMGGCAPLPMVLGFQLQTLRQVALVGNGRLIVAVISHNRFFYPSDRVSQAPPPAI